MFVRNAYCSKKVVAKGTESESLYKKLCVVVKNLDAKDAPNLTLKLMMLAYVTTMDPFSSVKGVLPNSIS